MTSETEPAPDVVRRFRTAYGLHRQAQGHGAGGVQELLALPSVRTGPNARYWSVRARTFQRFMASTVARRIRAVAPRPIRIVDLGAGNGWLCYRVVLAGQRAVAVDLRNDTIDGLGAAAGYRSQPTPMFGRVVASFDHLPLASDSFDLAVFNASLHYALDLATVLREAARIVAPGGMIATLDSPFYRHDRSGRAMVTEKRHDAARVFGDHSRDLAALPFIEYLTADRLREVSHPLGLLWQRRRVWYPLWYELRPMVARLRGARQPSRFDLWEAVVP